MATEKQRTSDTHRTNTQKKHENMAFPGKPVIRIKFCQANMKNENATFFSSSFSAHFCFSLCFFLFAVSFLSMAHSHFFSSFQCFWHFVLIIHIQKKKTRRHWLILNVIFLSWSFLRIFRYYLMSHKQWMRLLIVAVFVIFQLNSNTKCWNREEDR